MEKEKISKFFEDIENMELELHCSGNADTFHCPLCDEEYRVHIGETYEIAKERFKHKENCPTQLANEIKKLIKGK
jgi:hypothetical protein